MMQRVKIETLDTLIAELGTKVKEKKQWHLLCHLLELHVFGLVQSQSVRKIRSDYTSKSQGHDSILCLKALSVFLSSTSHSFWEPSLVQGFWYGFDTYHIFRISPLYTYQDHVREHYSP